MMLVYWLITYCSQLLKYYHIFKDNDISRNFHVDIVQNLHLFLKWFNNNKDLLIPNGFYFAHLNVALSSFMSFIWFKNVYASLGLARTRCFYKENCYNYIKLLLFYWQVNGIQILILQYQLIHPRLNLIEEELRQDLLRIFMVK